MPVVTKQCAGCLDKPRVKNTPVPLRGAHGQPYPAVHLKISVVSGGSVSSIDWV